MSLTTPICFIVLIIFFNRLLHWLTHLFSPKSHLFPSITLSDVLLLSAFPLMLWPCGPSFPAVLSKGSWHVVCGSDILIPKAFPVQELGMPSP